MNDVARRVELSGRELGLTASAAVHNPEAQQRLLDARSGGLAALKRECIRARREVESSERTRVRLRGQRGLRVWQDGDAMLHISAVLSPDDGDLVYVQLADAVCHGYRKIRLQVPAGERSESLEQIGADVFLALLQRGIQAPTQPPPNDLGGDTASRPQDSGEMTRPFGDHDIDERANFVDRDGRGEPESATVFEADEPDEGSGGVRVGQGPDLRCTSGDDVRLAERERSDVVVDADESEVENASELLGLLDVSVEGDLLTGWRPRRAAAEYVISLDALLRGEAGEGETTELVGVGMVSAVRVRDLVPHAFVKLITVRGPRSPVVVCHVGRRLPGALRQALCDRDGDDSRNDTNNGNGRGYGLDGNGRGYGLDRPPGPTGCIGANVTINVVIDARRVDEYDPAIGEVICALGRRIPAMVNPSQYINVHLRTALLVCGYECSQPGCQTRGYLEIDHHVEWSRGGLTAWENLRYLCWHHHAEKTRRYNKGRHPPARQRRPQQLQRPPRSQQLQQPQRAGRSRVVALPEPGVRESLGVYVAVLRMLVELGSARSVAERGVDKSDEGFAGAVTGDVLAHPGGDQGQAHFGGVGNVRGDDAVAERPEWVSLGQRFGVGDIERCAADRAIAQSNDEIVGDDMAAAADVDQPGVLGHAGKEVDVDETRGGRRQRERDHDDVGVGERFEQTFPRRENAAARDRLVVVAVHRDGAAEGFEQIDKRAGDAAAPKHHHAGADQVAADRPFPARGACIGVQSTQSGEHERERMFGDRWRVDTLAAGPHEPLVEIRQKRFDAGVGQLDPLHLRRAGDERGEVPGTRRIRPYHRLCSFGRGDGSTAVEYRSAKRLVHHRASLRHDTHGQRSVSHRPTLPARHGAGELRRPGVSEMGKEVVHMDIAESVLDLIGHTPLVRLGRMGAGLPCPVLAKLETTNPGGSVKDRAALGMLDAAEQDGLIGPGSTIIEKTSGNTGVGLAIVAAQRGYRCVFVMTTKAAPEKVALLRAYGAEVIVCPVGLPESDPKSTAAVSNRLLREIPNSYRPDQYANPANPAFHERTTGPEIWRQTGGRVTHFVATAGTGGTIAGTGRYLKRQNSAIEVVVADPEGSVYSGGAGRPYLVEGAGEDFWPANYDPSVVDTAIVVTDRDSFLTARRAAREEGLLIGGSCGTAVWAALEVAKRARPSDLVVVLIPDSGRGYLSKVFDDAWMGEYGFIDPDAEDKGAPRVRDMIRPDQRTVWISPAVSAGEALRSLDQQGTDIAVVVKGTEPYVAADVVGAIERGALLRHVAAIASAPADTAPAARALADAKSAATPVEVLMRPPLPRLGAGDSLARARLLLSQDPAALVHDAGRPVAVLVLDDLATRKDHS